MGCIQGSEMTKAAVGGVLSTLFPTLLRSVGQITGARFHFQRVPNMTSITIKKFSGRRDKVMCYEIFSTMEIRYVVPLPNTKHWVTFLIILAFLLRMQNGNNFN